MPLKIPEIDYNSSKGKHFFELLSLQDILGLHPKDHNQFDHHRIRFYVILIITEGKGIHSVDYTDCDYEKGTVFTLRKNNVHKFTKSNAKGKLLVFTEEFIAEYASKIQMLQTFQLFNEILDSPRIHLTKEVYSDIESITNQIEIEYCKINDTNSVEIIRSLLQILVLKLLRLKPKVNGNKSLQHNSYKLKEFQDLVEVHCLQNRKVSFYAEKMAMSSKRLNFLTQDTVEKSAKSFINEIAILQMKRLLMNSLEVNLKEISYMIGFNTPTNFSKFFKKHTGITPKEFKTSIR